MASLTIRQFIDKYKAKGRDKTVLLKISDYYKNNADSLNDGIIKDYIVVGDTVKQRIQDPYNIDLNEFNKFRKENKILAQGHMIVNKLIYLCLITSYYDTKDRMFIDMLGIIETGSKFSKYFPHGVTSPDTMKYVIEKEMSNKYLIKKHGSLFMAVQESITIIIDTPKLKEKFNRMNDSDIQYILNRISSTINQLMKGIANIYNSYKDKEITSQMITQSELDLEGKMSTSNNSIEVDNLKNIVVNYMPSSIDFEILKVLKIKSPIKKYVIKKLLLDKEKKYFSKFGVKFIDYYVKNYGDSIENMKKDFIPKLLTARLNDSEMLKYIDDISKDIKSLAMQYAQEDTSNMDGLNTNAGIYNFYISIKSYIIIKIRKFMNDIR